MVLLTLSRLGSVFKDSLYHFKSRSGNNWNEPLREWINLACHAEKLATSEDFYEIKAMVEKIGTNRRLLDRKIIFDFKKPFDLIPLYKSSYDKKLLMQKDFKNSSLSSKNPQSNIWSQLLNAARTYFENET